MSLYDDDDADAVAKTNVEGEGWSRGVLQMNAKSKTLIPTQTHAKPGGLSTPSGPKIPTRTPYVSPLAALGGGGPTKGLFPSAQVKTVTTVLPSPGAGHFGNNDRAGGKKRAARHGLLSGKDRNGGDKKLLPLGDPLWTVVNEYDPLWPNDYTKVKEDIRASKRAAERAKDEEDSSGKRRYTEGVRDKARERFHGRDGGDGEVSGFGRRPRGGEDDYSDNDDDEGGGGGGGRRGRDTNHRRSAGSTGGAAIAPPPSLTESSANAPPPSSNNDKDKDEPGEPKGGLGFAAKIMAKYGYKQGQGLGKSQQGMSQALAVEKTSKRGGRIVHEDDFKKPLPNMFGESFKTPQLIADEYNDEIDAEAEVGQPDQAGGGGGQEVDEYGNSLAPPSMMPPPPPGPIGAAAPKPEEAKPSITDLMKNPSKVVLCKNMVGPGEVDDDLEPEVKEECNGKYGDVSKVVIFEMPNEPPEEAVRIFIEFKRVESAIKAVVDLNGRFFGGREVQARFYDQDKFSNLSLYN